MFGWLARRAKSEHRKLAYQNFQAATDPEMPFLATMKGGFDAAPTFAEARRSSENLIGMLAKDEKPPHHDVDAALHLNKDLRRIYDAVGRTGRGSFDQVYKPLGGWTSYFERSSNELHLIDAQQEIDQEAAQLRRR